MLIMPLKDLISLIGNTPAVPLSRIGKMVPAGSAGIFAKMEGFNPGGSVKDRIALSMVEAAEKEGRLEPGGTIIEPTSGNTGIGLAMVGLLKGYKVILTMPDSMTMERRQLLSALGAELVLTPGAELMSGPVRRAEEILKEHPEYYMPQQFNNPANPEVHRRTTALEIIEALGGVPDAFVSGVGTGGTITGVGEVFKSKRKDALIYAVEPKDSAVLSGGPPGKHKIAGIGAGFVPEILNTEIYDEVVQVSNEDAARTTRELSLKEGLLCGISSGAAMWAALQVAKKLGKGKKVVVIFPDRGERYLSTGLFLSESP